ncbi:hypothetical protein HXY32_04420 [Candidatus Bathyarchaeota archaeon]|nr:hypothetical protein [Candidatus Bathyarchaeota archaeon]
MSEGEVKKCPKCCGEMEEGERFLFPFFLIAEELGEKTILFSCKNCGYIELYKEIKEKKE